MLFRRTFSSTFRVQMPVFHVMSFACTSCQQCLTSIDLLFLQSHSVARLRGRNKFDCIVHACYSSCVTRPYISPPLPGCSDAAQTNRRTDWSRSFHFEVSKKPWAMHSSRRHIDYVSFVVDRVQSIPATRATRQGLPQLLR